MLWTGDKALGCKLFILNTFATERLSICTDLLRDYIIYSLLYISKISRGMGGGHGFKFYKINGYLFPNVINCKFIGSIQMSNLKNSLVNISKFTTLLHCTD